ncbi:MAG: FtsX-like permease family protein [Cytophagales bacterium]|nr:FtsX-like permease family protein [Cytophagales bacterium]
MWFNYFLTTFRSLRRNSFYVLANLLSLGVAFALMIIGYFNYEFNHSFNKFFPDAENVFKINSTRLNYADDVGMGVTPLPLKASIATSLEETRVSRYKGGSLIVRQGESLIRQRSAYVDEGFLKMFPFPSIQGLPINLQDKSQVLLTKESAMTLFNRTDLEGEQLVVQRATSQESYVIRGVLDDFPENISFRFDLVFLFEDYLDQTGLDPQDWSHWVDATFIQPGNSGPAKRDIEQLLNQDLVLQNQQNKGREVAAYRLDNILDWPGFENQLYQSSFVGVLHPASVLGTISSAVFVLLLASFNFINISISLSGQRLKEIAMRKVLGGSKQSIVQQFLFENLILVIISIGLSVGLASWLIPAYNALFDYNIVQFEFLNWRPFIFSSSLLFLVVILIAGGYPAWYVSRFSSLHIFRDKVRLGGRGKLMGLLIGLQFVICFYNVFSLLVFVENADYQLTLDRGYQVEKVLNVPVENFAQMDLLNQSLDQLPEVTSFGGTQHLIGFHTEARLIRFNGADQETEVLSVGENYLETVKVRLIKGRTFRAGQQDQKNVLINELMERKLGGEVLGKNMLLEGQLMKVIGVVEDFNLKTILLDNEIKPAMIKQAAQEDVKYLSVISNGQSGKELDARVEQLWYSLFPDKLYGGFLQERVTRPLRQTNNIVISINSFVAVVAIFISILGLYATVSLSISRRIKELGIRKVLGATVWQIAYSLNHRIILILTVASVVGLTGGFLFISNLLDIIYAYHIDIAVRHFVFPLILILLIVLGSVGWKIGNAVRQNPVKQLRAE